MFTRFRETGRRLQVSLVETHRVDGGRVRHTHIASLGSVGMPASAADRITFWGKLHQRLAGLGNRVNGEAQAAIMGAVHSRIPMPTLDDQRAVQLENAKANAHFWETLHGMHADRVEGNKGMTAILAQNIVADEAAATAAADMQKAATELTARVERGEDVAAIGKPMTGKELMKVLGITAADMRHYARLAEIGETAIPDVAAAGLKAGRQAERTAARAILARRRRSRLPGLEP